MPIGLLTGLGIFKTLLDSARGLKDISDTAIRNAAIVELQEKILTAQAQQTALVERISDLEKEVASFKAWGGEKKRYRLTDFGSGTFAYALKPEASDGEPSHYACANCYKDERIAILQFSHRGAMGQDIFRCHGCKGEFKLGTPRQQPTRTASDDDSNYF